MLQAAGQLHRIDADVLETLYAVLSKDPATAVRQAALESKVR